MAKKEPIIKDELTPKKAAKQATAKTDEQKLADKRAELLTAKKGLYDRTLQNPHKIKAIKKDIARLLTKINAKKGAK